MGSLLRRKDDGSATEPPFDPTSWHGALLVMVGVAAVLWIVQIFNAANDYSFDREAGLRPRQIDGLWGVVTEPFLHVSYAHLLSNTAPFVLIGWALLLSGVRAWLIVTSIVIVLSGFATWLVAPHGLVVGASSLVFGWMGYLMARAYFSRRLKWIFTAVVVLFFFGTLLGGLLPSVDSHVSWQAHVCGFGAGIVTGWLLHPRRHGTSGRERAHGRAVS